LVTAGGLQGSSDTWVSSAYYDANRLTEVWEKGVIGLLRAALRAGRLHTKMTIEEIEAVLTVQEKRWWWRRKFNRSRINGISFNTLVAM
jgi:hypothetical protein